VKAGQKVKQVVIIDAFNRNIKSSLANRANKGTYFAKADDLFCHCPMASIWRASEWAKLFAAAAAI
jgi:hypothetical protein